MAAREQEIGYTVLVETDRVFASPDQPRDEITDAEIKEFAEGIRMVGQLEPAIVKVKKENGPETTYTLVAGERRWRSCILLNRKLWCVVRIVRSEAEHFRDAAISNLSPRPLTGLAAANALARVLKDYPGMSQTQLGQAFGKSQVWASKYLALLKLVPEVKAMLSFKLPHEKRLGVYAAAELAGLPRAEQVKEANRVLKLGLPTVLARAHIRATSKRLGVAKERKASTSPRKYYRALSNFLRGVDAGAQKILSRDSKSFDLMFAAITPAKRHKLLSSIQQRIDSLGQIQARAKHSSRARNVSVMKLAV